jgi:two-component system LytT family response regulator
MTIRTLIIDDEPLARDRIKRLLRDEDGLHIIGECGNGTDAVKSITEMNPDLVFPRHTDAGKERIRSHQVSQC